jgi:hypothetical protein
MITQQQLSEISDFVTAQGMGVNLPTELREKFSDIHFTVCMDDDVVSATPVLEQQQFNLYLIDSSNHCLSFTQNHELATGVVVAELEEE